MRNILAGILMLACCAVGVLEARAETRLALVIGNAQYRHASPLLNPGNDAQLMTRVLEGVGFRVTRLIDATRDQMLREMLAFGRSLQQPNTVGLFYYAGHGIQVNGLNYLVPVEADVKSENEVRLQRWANSCRRWTQSDRMQVASTWSSWTPAATILSPGDGGPQGVAWPKWIRRPAR